MHNRYILPFLNTHTYQKYANVYLKSKRWEVREIYAFLIGTGLVEVTTQVSKGVVV